MVIQANENYVKVLGTDPPFWHFILSTELVYKFGGWWEVSEEADRRIQLLLSPHHETLLKAYYARLQDDANYNMDGNLPGV